MTRKGIRAFSLIELLVVVATIAILMSILLPVARFAVDKADRSACISNLHTIAQAVEAYRQDNLVYPGMPGVIGQNGIQEGGVTGLALADSSYDAGFFWCNNDPYPSQLYQFRQDVDRDGDIDLDDVDYNKDNDGDEDDKADREAYQRYALKYEGLLRDTSYSTYDFGFNYYGYVTTEDGMPFPVTSQEAFVFFMGNPWKVYFEKFYRAYYTENRDGGMSDEDASTDAAQKAKNDADNFTAKVSGANSWDLQMVKPYTENGNGANNYDTDVITSPNMLAVSLDDTRPHGLFPGLWNVRAPRETVVTFCPNHPTESPKLIPAALLSGEAVLLKPVRPIDATGAMPSPGIMARTTGPNNKSLRPAIDWRINKAPLPQTGKNDNLFLDNPSMKNDGYMPIVGVAYRMFRMGMGMDPDQNGSRWYNTGMEFAAGDMIMVVAKAKWNYYPLSSCENRAFWTDSGITNPRKDYDALFSKSAVLLFSADGNPVEAKYHEIPANMVMAKQPHARLVGYLGELASVDDKKVFALGSRSSHLVTPTEVPVGESRPLMLTLNDTKGDYDDNTGWCQVWIAIYHPPT